MPLVRRCAARSLALFCACILIGCGASADGDAPCNPADVACRDGEPGRGSEEPESPEPPEEPGEPSEPAEPVLRTVRLTSLQLKYDLQQPVFVNNSIPIEFGLAATSEDPARPATRDVALYFSFVDPDSSDPNLGCASSATNVEVLGDGVSRRFTGALWPTSECEGLAGDGVIVNLRVSFDPALAEEGIEAPSVTLTEANRNAPANQACITQVNGNPQRGCVFPIALRPTPVDADGSNLIDVRLSSFESASSVAVLPIANEGGPSRPSLAIEAALLVNGRDPYVSVTRPEQVPAALEQIAPGIREGLEFGLTAEQLEALSQLPGQSRLSFALSAASDQQIFLPLRVGTDDGRVDSAVIEELLPGIRNTVSRDLFIEGETRAALEAGGQWAEETRFVVRSCFLADFVQAGNEGEDDISDCRAVDVLMVREQPLPGGGPSRDFDKTYDKRVGKPDRISVSAALESRNRLSFEGASSHIEGRVELRGKFGRTFSLELAKAFATAELKLDEGESTYEAGLFAFGVRVRSFFERRPSVRHEDPFSVGREFEFPNLGFGFGPVRIGFKVAVGGEVALDPELTMDVFSDPSECQTALNSSASLDRCGVITRRTSPEFSLTGRIEGGIDIFIAKAGVEASLNVAITSFPLTAQLAWGLTDDTRLLVRGDTRFDLELQLIRGDVSIVGRIGFPRFGAHLKVNLFSFASRRLVTNLLDLSLDEPVEL